MDSNELKKYIDRPDSLNKEQSGELQKLIKQYPYCTTLHLLFLKSLYNSKYDQFEDYLHQSSAFIHNREHFYEWLHHSDNSETEVKEGDHHANTSEKFTHETQEERESRFKDELRQIEKEKDFSRKLESENTSEDVKSNNKQNNSSELINEFINNEPKIVPDKESDFKEETQKADSSIQDNQEFISETLAQIYQRQGKINKAIEIYEKLSLKFPEKKRYFAQIIQDLKDQQHTNYSKFK